MSRFIHTNYLTSQNGCKILQVSSQTINGPCSNILSNIRNKVWLTEGQPPQYCIIDVKSMINKPQVFNSIGFDCWLDYDTNPALIQISVKYQNGAFITIAKIRLEKKNGWQDFKINEINSKQAKLIKITIQENFGDQKTYINQIALSYHNFEAQIKNSYASKQKTIAQANRLTSRQKQLKKANQKIKQLSQQVICLKSQLSNHQQVLLKMQDTMKKLSHKIKILQDKQQLQDDILKNKSLKFKSQPLKSFDQVDSQSYILHPSNKQSIKSKPNQIFKKQIHNLRQTYQQKHQQDSQISLSQYSQSPLPKNNYTSMLQSLQKLIAKREEKKNLLKKQKKSQSKRIQKNSNSQQSDY